MSHGVGSTATREIGSEVRMVEFASLILADNPEAEQWIVLPSSVVHHRQQDQANNGKAGHSSGEKPWCGQSGRSRMGMTRRVCMRVCMHVKHEACMRVCMHEVCMHESIGGGGWLRYAVRGDLGVVGAVVPTWFAVRRGGAAMVPAQI